MAYQLEHRTTKTVTRGTHYPLGATLTPTGIIFALYSQHATEVFLLLFDQADGDPTDVIRLEERDKFVWHAHVNGAKAGQLYGYKVRGEYHPEWGLRFNDAKLLLDVLAHRAASCSGHEPSRLRRGGDLQAEWLGERYRREQVLGWRDDSGVRPRRHDLH